LERVLVCIIAQTRAHQVAWPSFKRFVLDELDADLALAVTLDEEYDYVNPYWQHAKYRWTSYQPPDIGDTFDLAQRWLWDRDDAPPPDWRSMLRLKGIWQGGIQAPDPQPSFSANLLYCRWLLLRGLMEDEVLERYDRFVVTRSDFVWLCPHPPMSILDRESIWIPDGQHWGGFCDRHIVVSREDAVAALNLIDDILLRPDELYAEMKLATASNDEEFHRHHRYVGWNLEMYLKYHLDRKGLLPKVKLFPYVMYTGRPLRDPQSKGWGWSTGSYHPSVGHFVKYEGELREANAYAKVIKSREDWEKGTWRTFQAAQHRPSALEQSWSVGRKVLSGLRRPGRMARARRYVRRDPR
jgi:hypothetical protein